MTLPTIEFETCAEPEFVVIWLHGLGADGSDFVPVAKALQLPARFVFPHAPVRPVTLNGGYRMRAWYDIYSLDMNCAEDREGIFDSQRSIAELIAREERRGVVADHVFLAGFSQGGAIALHAGLRHPSKLAGLLALSTYLPLADTVRDEAHPANSRTPVFMAHGVEDDVIPISAGLASRNALVNLGHDVAWRQYGMAHSVCQDEIEDISGWMTGIISGIRDTETP
ncbi:MAG: alpha/beta hydrolase [Burkholderiales bacterium]|nr:alpha/beta hydrolase [Burkholderiales bacterium]